ncbi:MAG: spondin domain-containing protein [Planctomycetes bacterium]|nr:spondin domain-containing protein [Planctomycetota bacterium]
MRRVTVYIAVLLLPLSSISVFGDVFTLTIENVGVQPLTPVFVATHDATFDIFDAGVAASAELVAIAEGGDTGPLELLASGAAGVLDYGVVGLAPILPGEVGTIEIMADADHPYLSFASMLPVTNDAFIGLAAGDAALDRARTGRSRARPLTACRRGRRARPAG